MSTSETTLGSPALTAGGRGAREESYLNKPTGILSWLLIGPPK